MVNMQRLILIDHPDQVFTMAAFLLSLLSLRGTPSFFPLVLLLTTVHLYVSIIHKQNSFGCRFLVFGLVVTLARSLANLTTATYALSTPIMPLLIMAGLSFFESFISLSMFIVYVKLCGHIKASWARMTLFPVLWTTCCTGITSVNPIGRLLMWSPVQGFGSYEWLYHISGPSGIDWTVAACAVICSEVIGQWLIGPQVQIDGEDIRIVELDDDARSSTFHHSESHYVLIFTGIVVALTLPSFVLTGTPLPPSSGNTTPLTVGCILPSSIYDKHHNSTLEDFIAASMQMTNAKILIWPENAVTFANAEERDTAFNKVRREVRGPAVGVSFEEFVPAEPGGRLRMKRNGFALLAPNNTDGPAVALEYYKRHLVPIAESFSVIPSSDPPAIISLDLLHPKHVSKSDWAPAPNYTRPIPVTASICLDFSSSAAFSALSSRPALILAPAQTWHPGIGLAMWEQAKARAEEIGSMVLWCDGGEGGVSGVAGGGMTDFMQFGEGSWSRTIGVQWPFDESRTVYAQWGDWYTLLVLWLLFGAVWVGGESDVQDPLGIHSAKGSVQKILASLSRWRNRWRAPIEAQGGESQSLLD